MPTQLFIEPHTCTVEIHNKTMTCTLTQDNNFDN